MASKSEENAGSDTEIEENAAQKKKPATHDSVGAADLDKVTDYVEEEDFSTQGLEEALKIAQDRQAKEGIDKQEREKALSKVKIRKEDVDLIINEMEISRQAAERKLREHMGNVVEALADMTGSSVDGAGDSELGGASDKVGGAEGTDVTEAGSLNDSFLLCQRCDSVVLRPGLAKLLEKSVFLPHMRRQPNCAGAEGETLSRHWHVPTMHTFENVGFTKNVGSLKYLICADCEIGPIGVYDTSVKNSFYVALDRIKHGSEPATKRGWP